MKHFLVMNLFFMLFFVSCKNEHKNEIFFRTSIYGKVSNLAKNESRNLLYLKMDDSLFLSNKKNIIDSCYLSDAGDFLLEFSSSKLSNYFLYLNNRQIGNIYVVPGDSLRMVINSLNNHFEFTGKSKLINNHYKDFLQVYIKNFRENPKLKTDDFKEYHNYLIQTKIRFLKYVNSFQNRQNINENYFIDLSNAVNYTYAYKLTNFILENYYWDFSTTNYLSVEPSKFDFLNRLELNNPDALCSIFYRSFIKRYATLLYWKWKREHEDKLDFKERLNKKLELINKTFQGIVKEYLFSKTIYDHLYECKTIDELNDVNSNIDSVNISSFSDQINGMYLKKLELFNSNLAPDFTLINIDKDSVRLSDLRGKILYLDFWGTWCAPCIEEIPSSIELYDGVDKNKFEFVYVGFETKNYDAWEKYVRSNNIPGVNLYLEGQFTNATAKDYLVNYVPRYVLIDENMKIISPYAKRPSQFSNSEEFMSYVHEEINKMNQ